MFFLNLEDRNQSYVGIGMDSYEPKGSKGKNPTKSLSYRIPVKFLQTKGGLEGTPTHLLQPLICPTAEAVPPRLFSF